LKKITPTVSPCIVKVAGRKIAGNVSNTTARGELNNRKKESCLDLDAGSALLWTGISPTPTGKWWGKDLEKEGGL
jgi:hypothetical protein